MKQSIVFGLLLTVVAGSSCQVSKDQVTTKLDVVSKDSLTLVDPLIELPRIVIRPKITYPSSLRPEKRIVVYVKATIDTAGKSSNIAIVRASHTPFDTLAITFAAQYKFSPGKIDGKIVTQTISWPIEFLPN